MLVRESGNCVAPLHVGYQVLDKRPLLHFELSGIQDGDGWAGSSNNRSLVRASCHNSEAVSLRFWQRRKIPQPSVLGGKAGGRSQSAVQSTSGSYKQNERTGEVVALLSPRNPAKEFSRKQRALVVICRRCELVRVNRIPQTLSGIRKG